MTKRMTLRQCFNFLEANNVLLYVTKDSATDRNQIVLTFSRRDGDGRSIASGYCRTPADTDIPFEDLLSLLCETAKDKYEGLKDE